MAYFDIYGAALPGTINSNYSGSVVLGLQFKSAVAWQRFRGQVLQRH